MSQWAYYPDEDGDLVNLHLVELIRIQKDPDSDSVVLCAQMPGDEGACYALKRGTEAEVLEVYKSLVVALCVNL